MSLAHALRTLGEACQGILFTRDAGLLVLEQPASSSISDSKACYRVISVSSVADFSVLSEPPKRPEELPLLPEVNQDFVKTREERAIEKAKAEGDKVCQDATAYAQSLFNELHKTMPCDWMVKSDGSAPGIMVMEAVMIMAPYNPDSCKARSGEDRLKERVQKVLTGILRKLNAEYQKS